MYLLVSELALTIASQDVVKVVKIIGICVVVVGDVSTVVLTNIVPACVAVESGRGVRIRGKGRGRKENEERREGRREGGRVRERGRVRREEG